METQAHTCPLFNPVDNVKENGGTSCGNCHNYNPLHVENRGKYICMKYEEVVNWCRNHSTN